MDTLTINTKKLISAAAQAGIEQTEIKGLDATKTNTAVALSEMPLPVLEALLRTGKLGQSAKQAIRRLLGDRVSDEEFDQEQKNLIKISNIMTRLVDDVEPTLEFELAGQTYPIFMTSCHVQQYMFGKILAADFNISMTSDGTANVRKYLYLNEEAVATDDGVTIRTILAAKGLRPIKQDTIDRWKAGRATVKKMHANDVGKQFICTGSAVKMSTNWWEPTVVLPKGYVGRVVIEPDMETQARNAYYEEANVGYKYLQLARCFSLDTKEYVYIDVENLKEYEYDTKANDRLVLPTDMKGVLTSLFNWNGSEGFGDIFNDRHGGVVVLAAGKPGVGKTLTAEVYAHIMQRPLYSIDLTELGTTVDKVEASLSTIFQRVTRWNAVLLLDEADIFMAERQKEELERSAIVGVFLRVLDRYKGTLFLTTNRTEVLDPAFASRITVKLDYPDLDLARRTRIWELMLEKADIKPEGSIEALASLDLNGRQIRNCVRLIRIIHPNAKTLPAETLESIAKMNVNTKS